MLHPAKQSPDLTTEAQNAQALQTLTRNLTKPFCNHCRTLIKKKNAIKTPSATPCKAVFSSFEDNRKTKLEALNKQL